MFWWLIHYYEYFTLLITFFFVPCVETFYGAAKVLFNNFIFSCLPDEGLRNEGVAGPNWHHIIINDVWGKYIKPHIQHKVFIIQAMHSDTHSDQHLKQTNTDTWKRTLICLSLFSLSVLVVWNETNANILICDVVWSKSEKGNCLVLPPSLACCSKLLSLYITFSRLYF